MKVSCPQDTRSSRDGAWNHEVLGNLCRRKVTWEERTPGGETAHVRCQLSARVPRALRSRVAVPSCGWLWLLRASDQHHSHRCRSRSWSPEGSRAAEEPGEPSGHWAVGSKQRWPGRQSWGLAAAPWQSLVNVCSWGSLCPGTLPRMPFLPTPAGDEGLATNVRAHRSPHTRTSCLPLWHWVPKGGCFTQRSVRSPAQEKCS